MRDHDKDTIGQPYELIAEEEEELQAAIAESHLFNGADNLRRMDPDRYRTILLRLVYELIDKGKD